MRRGAFALGILLLIAAGCATKPTPPSTESPSGTWSGDYGPNPDQRDPITVDLVWENTNLRGTVHAGPRSLLITKASFDRDSGAITMEFDAQANDGRTIHYVAQGKVASNTMTGTWTRDDQRGDFRVTKQ